MIVTPEQTGDDIQEIKELLNVLISEIQSLRRVCLPVDPGAIVLLLSEVYKIFGSEEWPAAWVFEQSEGDDLDSMRLRGLLSKCLKGKLTIRRLSFFLSKVTGWHGNYCLQRCGKFREGVYYKIVMK